MLVDKLLTKVLLFELLATIGIVGYIAYEYHSWRRPKTSYGKEECWEEVKAAKVQV
jgi:hypothetical protein